MVITVGILPNNLQNNNWEGWIRDAKSFSFEQKEEAKSYLNELQNHTKGTCDFAAWIEEEEDDDQGEEHVPRPEGHVSLGRLGRCR